MSKYTTLTSRTVVAVTVIVIVAICWQLYSALGYSSPPAPQLSQTCTTHRGIYPVMGYPALRDGRDLPYTLLVAATPDTYTYGLMHIKDKSDICGHDGMIFILPRREVVSFWNKNTLTDLTLHWIDGDVKIGESDLPAIVEGEAPVTVVSPGAVTMVVELIREDQK